MWIITVNTGSVSVKLAAFDMERDSSRAQHETKLAGAGQDPAATLQQFAGECGIQHPDAVAHRVVHGGESLIEPSLLDENTEAEIERLSTLAPLHNPVALRWIRAARESLGADLSQVAVFDTAFYATLPAVAAHYALPAERARRLGVRRYGFHGIAHRALWQRWCELRPEPPAGGRLISLQLGGGCSITASEKGVARDTSMGFSPTEGLVMASRPGDVDPGALTYWMRREGLDPETAEHMLNHECGLIGLSGKSDDMRALIDVPDARARHAVDLYCYRARKYIGAYLAVLGGADGVVFGGGVGEHMPEVRRRILSGLEWAGIQLDPRANAAARGQEAHIAAPGSPVDVWVLPVQESAILAGEARALLESGESRGRQSGAGPP
ncbi:MAG: acetate/propionate family kinase [Gammaproteobacteria bacterium]|nr:acetate/propionate family kinase [Gammaproteobacteria bacterium]NIR28468.1 acetate/propionate family kinase [Gammaproteobacteria bacterium]NIR96914.1 acetate/propionate family kinase [Gammaproteobacteria bacterium]NIT62615.1 acetate/propionate family kinase [Gammaproteobacteria bacterium]NIV19572.1 acetate/propionate family kinase [Gammaproteobacteria bacterium]